MKYQKLSEYKGIKDHAKDAYFELQSKGMRD
jgi:hypothetical protein